MARAVSRARKRGKSAIHIKPSKKGTFTAWCKRQGFSGASSACIAKAKKSNSSAIRKKAVFAQNAKRWKH